MKLIFKKLIFAWIYFCECKFCYISRRFIFGDGAVLIVSRTLIFVVARYAMFMSSMIIAGKNKFFQNLLIIRSVKKQNHYFKNWDRAKKERRQKFRVDLFLWIEKWDNFRGDKLSRICQKLRSLRKLFQAKINLQEN